MQTPLPELGSPHTGWVLTDEFDTHLKHAREQLLSAEFDRSTLLRLRASREFLAERIGEAGQGGGYTSLTEGALTQRFHAIQACLDEVSSEEAGATYLESGVELDAALLEKTLIGESTSMQVLRQEIAAIAPWKFHALVLGDSGTGKELVARSIHLLSGRQGPLITENCGALNHDLYMSDLFGHEKGAFTGAVSMRAGMIERANSGTLFLDEIGTLPPRAQSALLRVIEYQEFQRLGGEAPIKVDVRIVAATNEDLMLAVEQDRFREDLLFRLRNTLIQTPSLSEHLDDIPALCAHHLNQLGPEIKRVSGSREVVIAPDAMALLETFSWPGNVRQLQNVLNSALTRMADNVITGSDLPLRELSGITSSPDDAIQVEHVADAGSSLSDSKGQVEALAIRAALDRNNWVRTQTAAELQIDRTTLYKKMKRYGIERD